MSASLRRSSRVVQSKKTLISKSIVYITVIITSIEAKDLCKAVSPLQKNIGLINVIVIMLASVSM